MQNHLIKISKFLSLVLRHNPSKIGIALDSEGWVAVDELLQASHCANVPLTRELLEQIVEQNDKQRFSFSTDGLKIRANQGHSIPVDLGLESQTPPEILYHGTATRFLSSIEQQGLISKGRNQVHLSPDEQTAIKVGQRHGKPVVLHVLAQKMCEHGLLFYRSANGVWLTDSVPREFLRFPGS